MKTEKQIRDKINDYKTALVNLLPKDELEAKIDVLEWVLSDD